MNPHENIPTPPPEPPRLKMGTLPELDDNDDPPSWVYPPGDFPSGEGLLSEPPPGWTITEPTDISTLTPSTLFHENEIILEDTIPNRPLIAPLAPMSVLREEYEGGNQVFIQQIDWLVEQGYKGIRRAKGDGDCFYRSLAFAYVERILNASEPGMVGTQAISLLETTPSQLELVGFQLMVTEDFYDALVDLIKRIAAPEGGKLMLSSAELLAAFNDPMTSNSIVMFLRLLTSAQMRLDPDQYTPYLTHPELGEAMEMRDFCETFVEATGKEADHVQMAALSRALQCKIRVAYLDGRARGQGKVEVEYVNFDDQEYPEQEPIKLLYRPGHYDILDSRSGVVGEELLVQGV